LARALIQYGIRAKRYSDQILTNAVLKINTYEHPNPCTRYVKKKIYVLGREEKIPPA
jgi:hypothetical protein